LVLGSNESSVAIAVGDLRGDGKLDIVTANTNPPTNFLIVRLGNGNGTFQPAINIPVTNGILPHAGLILTDLNGDGKIDMVVNSEFSIDVFLGNGDGTFQAPITFGTLEPTNALAVGDFNHDGKPDLIVNEYASGVLPPNLPSGGVVEMFLGNGNGTFRSAGVTPTGNFGYAIAVGDFNGDNNLDAAVENTSQVATALSTVPSVDVLLGNGDGTFEAPTSFEIGPSQVAVEDRQGLAAGDFTGSGKPDLAATDITTNNVTVLLNQDLPATTIVTGSDVGIPAEERGFDQTGKLLFRFQPFLPGFSGGVRVAYADFNGDGVPDIVTASGAGMATEVRIFDGVTGWQIAGPLGTLQPYSSLWAGGAFVAAGDVDGDGDNDLVTGADAGGGPHVKVFDGATGAIMQYASRPDLIDGFYAYDPRFGGGVRVAVGDVAGAGHPDIITGAGPGGGPHVHVYDAITLAEVPLNNQPGFNQGFMAYAPTFQGGIYVADEDVNGDGHADVIVSSNPPAGAPQVEILSGADGSILGTTNAYGSTLTGSVTVAALNLSGALDVVTGGQQGSGPDVRLFDAKTLSLLQDFIAYDATFQGGVFVG
jgi:hypothetical protein